MADRQRLIRLHREYQWRLWSRDEISFIESAVKIKHPERGMIPFKLRDAQREALDVFARERYVITLKARQVGWSTLLSAHVLWLTLFFPNREIILISRTEREAVDLLGKVKYAYRNLPDWLKARAPELLTEHQQLMPFSNSSIIKSMPSASDPARGSSAYLVVVDEWAFLPNQEEAWASIEPVTNVGGRVIGLSTANGSGNFFHELWVGAETGTNSFYPLFVSWRGGDRNDAWYENQRRLMNEWQLAQEYPNTPEEAFIKSGRPVFDLEAVEAQQVLKPRVGYLKVV